MKVYTIKKHGYFTGYLSFRRLMKEERIAEICEKVQDKVPEKEKLPVKIAFNQIEIGFIDVDERI
jgi:hypothetical protein